MQIQLRVGYQDETKKDLLARAVDIVAFEEQYDISMADLKNKLKMTHLFFLAWHVENRTGGTTDDFKKWLESVDSVETVEPKK